MRRAINVIRREFNVDHVRSHVFRGAEARIKLAHELVKAVMSKAPGDLDSVVVVFDEAGKPGSAEESR